VAELLYINAAGADGYGQVHLGQMFTPDADWLIESVWVNPLYVLAAGNVACTLWLDDSFSPTGSVLATSGVQAVAETPGGPETFTFASPYQTTRGLSYWAVFHLAATQCHSTRTSGVSNEYTGGKIGYSAHASDPTDTWVVDGGDGFDLIQFKINGSILAGSSGHRGFTTRSTLLHRRR